MEVILLKDFSKVGARNEVVTVSEGYAVNFLIPRGIAKAATAGSKRNLEVSKEKAAATTEAEYQKIADDIRSIDGKSITLHHKANEKGNLFATLHTDAVGEGVYDQLGVCLPEDVFEVEPIKALGTFEVPLKSQKAKGSLTVLVERDGK